MYVHGNVQLSRKKGCFYFSLKIRLKLSAKANLFARLIYMEFGLLVYTHLVIIKSLKTSAKIVACSLMSHAKRPIADTSADNDLNTFYAASS